MGSLWFTRALGPTAIAKTLGLLYTCVLALWRSRRTFARGYSDPSTEWRPGSEHRRAVDVFEGGRRVLRRAAPDLAAPPGARGAGDVDLLSGADRCPVIWRTARLWS